MEAKSKSEAQSRADQIKAFKSELALLEKEDVATLNSEQSSAINAHHQQLLDRYAEQFDVDRSSGQKQLSLGMKIASFLGAIAFAASVFFLFYQFWGLLSTTLQIVVLLTGPLVTLVATFITAQRDSSGYFVKLVAMVCFACFVINIMLLGQIFNITPSDKALVVWGAFAFLLAYRFDLRLLLAAGIVCLIGFISARTGTWSGMYWLHFGERPENFFPAALLLFWIPSLLKHRTGAEFNPIYRVFGLLSLFFPILILSNWAAGSYIYGDADVIEGSYQVLGFALSAAVIWLGVVKGWQHVVNTGNIFFVVFLYTKFFDWWWDWMPKYLFFLVIGLTALLFLFVFKRIRSLHAGTA